MNVQFAVKDGEVYVLEVNPRASRTVPFVAKATGRPLAKIAAKVMVGRTLDELGVERRHRCRRTSRSRSRVFPFSKFPGVDTILGPEMRSTGEVMGIAQSFALAFGKSLSASGFTLPSHGRAFISVKDDDKAQACHVARRLRNLGFTIVATRRHRRRASRARASRPSASTRCSKGSPHVVDAHPRRATIQLVINTTQGTKAIARQLFDPPQRAAREHPVLHDASPPAWPPWTRSRCAGCSRGAQVRSLQEWHTRAGEG